MDLNFHDLARHVFGDVFDDVEAGEEVRAEEECPPADEGFAESYSEDDAAFDEAYEAQRAAPAEAPQGYMDPGDYGGAPDPGTYQNQGVPGFSPPGPPMPAPGNYPPMPAPAGPFPAPQGPGPAPGPQGPDPGPGAPEIADEEAALLQQEADDAKSAWLDACQANLDSMSDVYAAQEAIQEDGAGREALQAAIEKTKPLAAAIFDLNVAALKAQEAADAAKRKVQMVGVLTSQKRTWSSAVQKANALHQRDSAAASQAKGLHARVKALGPKPTPRELKAQGQSLRQQRQVMRRERAGVKQALRAEIQRARGAQAKIPAKAPAKTPAKPPTQTQFKAPTQTPPKAPVKDVIRRPPPGANKKLARLHGNEGESMCGYTILGETVGEGFDVMSIISSFTGGMLSGGQKKPDGAPQPSQVQQMQMLQAQQEAQRARESAARATTAAWVVGGLAGAGALGAVLWKVLR